MSKSPGQHLVTPYPTRTDITGSQVSEAFDLGRILANAAYLIAGQFLGGACQFVRSALIARYLGPTEYGAWGFAFAFVSMFAAAADFGLSTLAVRDLARGESAGRYLGTSLRLKGALNLALTAIMLCALIALRMPARTNVLVLFMAGQMVLASFTLLVHSLFRARERMAIESSINLITAIASLAAIAVLVHVGAGIETLALSFLISSLSSLVLSVAIAFKGYLPGSLSWDRLLARRMLRESWPIGAAMITTGVYYFYDRVLMGALGQDRQIGLYTTAYATTLWTAGIVSMVRTAFLPGQAKAFAERGDPGSLITMYGRVSFGLGLPVGLGGIVVARPFLAAVYGSPYADAAFSMRLLCATSTLMFLSSFFGSNLLASGGQRRYLGGVALGAFANVALNSFMVPLWSLNGAAAATLIAELTVVLYMARECRPWLTYRDVIRMVQTPLVGALVMLLVLGALLPRSNFALAAVIAGSVYLLITLRLGIFKQTRAPDVEGLKAA